VPVAEVDGDAGEEVFTVNEIIRHKKEGKKVERLAPHMRGPCHDASGAGVCRKLVGKAGYCSHACPVINS
jgi:hypothetical protein